MMAVVLGLFGYHMQSDDHLNVEILDLSPLFVELPAALGECAEQHRPLVEQGRTEG